ncbi:MAG: MurR/RpiR family transcriptional regulator [Acidimicrobiaceae bacterium]|nr:MurR/RpiR family transcriptional regulator [Acidimicrobiaceae bacterium]MXW62248.1 MurR/RpiR family transcriptional regulator [Acidimicrobiaceae bacterium]MXW77227.1 MurR/RpiR family transcriptional regulator [Acidimicrobiaceae bacterium]MYA73090.1 MurR/RpiR family transcriptional regulator [Acidimicrobiaceae bacterium]MYC42105.1 MurR/RpiR family transcriptional regulator [Acidimicrobiaceae bacterium]
MASEAETGQSTQVTVSEIIARAGERLTPTERRIAEAVIAEPTLLAFGTVSDLADRIGTSRPSIVRFANKLGFDGYGSLQAVGRRRVEEALTQPRDRGPRDLSDRNSELDKLATGVETVVQIAARGEIWTIAERVAAAGSVWIVSGENSLTGAHALRSGLSMIRPRVHLVDEHSVGRDLIDAEQDDLGIAIDFYRYRRSTVAVTRTWAEHGIPIVAITDSPLSPLAASAEVLCLLSVPAVGPFDSSVPAVVVAELVVAAVAVINRSEAQDRIDRLEALWAETETFLPDA